MLPLLFKRKVYIVGLTNHRLLVVRMKPPYLGFPDLDAQLAVKKYSLRKLPNIVVPEGRRKSVLRLRDGAEHTSIAFRDGLGRRLRGNREHARLIMEGLQNQTK